MDTRRKKVYFNFRNRFFNFISSITSITTPLEQISIYLISRKLLKKLLRKIYLILLSLKNENFFFKLKQIFLWICDRADIYFFNSKKKKTIKKFLLIKETFLWPYSNTHIFLIQRNFFLGVYIIFKIKKSTILWENFKNFIFFLLLLQNSISSADDFLLPF